MLLIVSFSTEGIWVYINQVCNIRLIFVLANLFMEKDWWQILLTRMSPHSRWTQGRIIGGELEGWGRREAQAVSRAASDADGRWPAGKK
jgi:hypothetical protein